MFWNNGNEKGKGNGPTAMSRVYSVESTVAVALGSLIKQPLKAYAGMNANVTVNHSELVKRSLVAFDLLSFEDHFVLPCKVGCDFITLFTLFFFLMAYFEFCKQYRNL